MLKQKPRFAYEQKFISCDLGGTSFGENRQDYFSALQLYLFTIGFCFLLLSVSLGLYRFCIPISFPYVFVYFSYVGVYISTNTYIHIGEPTVGSYYKPCHVVEYYKYLRFFSDGKNFFKLV